MNDIPIETFWVGMNAVTPWVLRRNDPEIGNRNVRLFRDVVIYRQEKFLYGYRG